MNEPITLDIIHNGKGWTCKNDEGEAMPYTPTMFRWIVYIVLRVMLWLVRHDGVGGLHEDIIIRIHNKDGSIYDTKVIKK